MQNLGRCYSVLDCLCIGVDRFIRLHWLQQDALHQDDCHHDWPITENACADLHQVVPEHTLDDDSRRCSAHYMRVNHAGEVCAQALYYGQAVAARSQQLRGHFFQAAQEEAAHLTWCRQRLSALHSHVSYLQPVWYIGAWCIGVVAGLAGDRWSLGFMMATERQVTAHLTDHLYRLPASDQQSRAIVQQMRAEEAAHADRALTAGAKELPWLVQRWMCLTAKVMTTLAYWI